MYVSTIQTWHDCKRNVLRLRTYLQETDRDRLTFCEVDMRGPVLRPVGRLEVPDESLDAVLGGRDEVDGLHGRQRLAVLVDRLHDGDTLR